MKGLILACLLAVTAVTSAVPAKSKFQKPIHPVFAPKSWSPRIVGGQEATPHSIKYQAALHLGGYFCGGSLISDRWVLTAAHCGELTDTPQVVLGAHNVRQNEPEQQVYNGRRPIVHGQWDSQTLKNDISLIELPQSANLNANVGTVPLAESSAPDYAGSKATASGWGKPSDSANSISDVLRLVESTIITNADCANVFGSYVTSGHICLDGSQGKSTCSGDSGGPLTISGTQVGLTSYGSASGCEQGFPAAFTRISAYRDWIQQNSGV